MILPQKPLEIFKVLRPVLERIIVTMHEGASEQEVQSRGR